MDRLSKIYRVLFNFVDRYQVTLSDKFCEMFDQVPPQTWIHLIHCWFSVGTLIGCWANEPTWAFSAPSSSSSFLIHRFHRHPSLSLPFCILSSSLSYFRRRPGIINKSTVFEESRIVLPLSILASQRRLQGTPNCENISKQFISVPHLMDNLSAEEEKPLAPNIN